jgi:hypothetical protein
MAIKKDREPFVSRFKESFRNWLGVSTTAQVAPPDSLRMKTNGNEALNEFMMWYHGDATRLAEYYSTYIGADNAKSRYFYAVSRYEDNKKSHSGLPKAIVDTLCNTTGIPTLEIDKTALSTLEDETERKTLEAQTEERGALLQDIAKFNDLSELIKQEARARTLVVGGGCFIVSDLRSVDESLVMPIIEYVDERECEILTVGNIFKGVIRFVKYVHDETREKFTLSEKRTYNKIENSLWNDTKNGPASLSDLPETAHLQPVQTLTIDMIPAVPLRYKKGYRSYGNSIFDGKLDMFDDLDQTISQIAELVRKGSPVTYIDASYIETKMVNGKNVALTPKAFNRNVITVASSKNQEAKREIRTEQPSLNIVPIIDVMTAQKIAILEGILSPSSLGIEVQRNNNAEAMREKEKVTMVTRDDIIDNEKAAIEKLMKLAMRVDDVMNGRKTQEDDIAVDYPEYASPTFEQTTATLLPLWMADALSPEQFAKMLHTDTLTEADLQKEIAYLTEKKKSPALDVGDIFPDNEDGAPQEEEDKPEVPGGDK